jgi:hypothetical protein
MPTGSPSPHEVPFEGPIALERALFCLDCEMIFTDLACCPSCSSSAVWSLAQWLAPAQPSVRAESPPVGCPPVSDCEAEDSKAVA